MVTRKQLEGLSPPERIKKINAELEKRMKGLINEGIYPGSFSWILGKSIILNNISKELKIKFIYRPDKKEEDMGLLARLKIFLVDLLIKSKLLNHYRILKILDWFIKVPKMLFPIWVYEMDGHKLLMDEGDIPMRHILKDYQQLETWEPETTKIVKRETKEGMTCIDIGASIGYYTLLFARLVGPKGLVISFEPTEMNFNYLCENIGLNNYWDRVLPYKMAAWDKKELVKMPINSPKPIWANGVAVGQFLDRQGIDKVDFIKVDVDGPEPKVLKGLIKTFEKNPQLKMVIEYYPKYIRDGGLDPKEFMDILNRYFTWEKIPGDYEKGCWNLYCKRKNGSQET